MTIPSAAGSARTPASAFGARRRPPPALGRRPAQESLPKRQIGLLVATALVLGNMIGSGVFLLPSALAPYGSYSLVGWVISAGGALLLAGVFYRLARRTPRAGGPYAYSRDASGGCSASWWPGCTGSPWSAATRPSRWRLPATCRP